LGNYDDFAENEVGRIRYYPHEHHEKIGRKEFTRKNVKNKSKKAKYFLLYRYMID
jgi:hypothetical protein